jgi:hypothetical protein
MPLFSVFLLFSSEVHAPDDPPPTLEIAIRVVSAADEAEARAKAAALGQADETTYLNMYGETVTNAFLRIVEVQWLVDDHLFDGMEVASWMFKVGERLELSQKGIAVKPVKPDALFSAVRLILMRDWDPIGIGDEPAAQDEYDGYVVPLLHLLQDDASPSALAERLLRIETVEMGLPGDRERALRVAQKLRELR